MSTLLTETSTGPPEETPIKRDYLSYSAIRAYLQCPLRFYFRYVTQLSWQYQRTRKELFPVPSRIQNIGYERGENQRTAEWYRANHRTP